MYKIIFILLLLCTNLYAQNVTRVTNQSQHPYKHVPNDMNSIDSPADGETLTYDSATKKFEWAAGGGGGTPAGGLNAVQYNSPVGTFAGAETLLSFDGTNLGIGTTNGVKKLEVKGGDFYINNASAGLYMKSPDGTCAVCTINNSDIFSCSGVACP